MNRVSLVNCIMKKYFIFLGGWQVFIALGAIPAGFLFLLDTSGALMGTSPAMLAHSPFSSFLIPGLFLLVVNGLGNAAAAVLSFKRKSQAAMAGLFLGVVLCLWIVIQVYMIGFISFLQPLMFAVGAFEAVTGWILNRKT